MLNMSIQLLFEPSQSAQNLSQHVIRSLLDDWISMVAHDFLLQRALAALAAIWDRLRAGSLAALAVPPLRPPRRPKATAWGFLDGSTSFGALGSNLGVWPVDSSMIW
jgi:hypothetical protein